MLLIFLSTCISLKSSVSRCWDCSAVVKICVASSVLVTVPVNDAADVDSAAERNETAIRRRRRKRSVSVERNVETLVVVDPSMMDYYKNENIENYVLTIMNMVPPPHNTLA